MKSTFSLQVNGGRACVRPRRRRSHAPVRLMAECSLAGFGVGAMLVLMAVEMPRLVALAVR